MIGKTQFWLIGLALLGIGVFASACGDGESIDAVTDAGRTAMDAGEQNDGGREDAGMNPDLPDADGGGGTTPTYCPDLGAPGTLPTCPSDPTEVVVTGDIAGASWTCEHVYRLTSNVFVTSGTLSISAGTRIVADNGGALIVTPSARIDAQGHPGAPIVFTSSRPLGDRDRGDWGGIVLLGNAPLNVAGGTDNIEGIEASETRGVYGGTNAAHDCGTMRYVRIEFAGRVLGSDNELNGLTMGGCGSDTELEFVQMHRGLDDAFEIFGGSPKLRFIVATGMDDDGIDWDQGFTGAIQFAIVHRYGDSGSSDPNGIEADNLSADNSAMPRSNPSIYNVTVVTSDTSRTNQVGMVLRRGTYGTLRNVLVQGFPLGVDVRDAVSEAAVGTELSVMNSIFFMNTADVTAASPEATAFMSAGAMNRFGVDPMLATISESAPSYIPSSGSAVTTGAASPPAGFDMNAAYVGALAPGCPDWTAGWTSFPLE
jgi:hypothetical protein